jgi:hypothetical protein
MNFINAQREKQIYSLQNIKDEACTGFWWGNLRERDNWGDPGLDERIILKWIFRK